MRNTATMNTNSALNLTQPFFKGIFGTPTNVLSTTLVSRLFINLRVSNARLMAVRHRVDSGMIMFTSNMFPSTDLGDSADTEGNTRSERSEQGLSDEHRIAISSGEGHEGEAGRSAAVERNNDINVV